MNLGGSRWCPDSPIKGSSVHAIANIPNATWRRSWAAYGAKVCANLGLGTGYVDVFDRARRREGLRRPRNGSRSQPSGPSLSVPDRVLDRSVAATHARLLVLGDGDAELNAAVMLDLDANGRRLDRG